MSPMNTVHMETLRSFKFQHTFVQNDRVSHGNRRPFPKIHRTPITLGVRPHLLTIVNSYSIRLYAFENVLMAEKDFLKANHLISTRIREAYSKGKGELCQSTCWLLDKPRKKQTNWSNTVSSKTLIVRIFPFHSWWNVFMRTVLLPAFFEISLVRCWISGKVLCSLIFSHFSALTLQPFFLLCFSHWKMCKCTHKYTSIETGKSELSSQMRFYCKFKGIGSAMHFACLTSKVKTPHLDKLKFRHLHGTFSFHCNSKLLYSAEQIYLALNSHPISGFFMPPSAKLLESYVNAINELLQEKKNVWKKK